MTDTLQIDQYEAQAETLKRRVAELEAERTKIAGERDRAIVSQELAVAAAAAGVYPDPKAIQGAVDHALRNKEWKADENGEITLRAEDGYPAYQNGVAVTPSVFMRTTLRQEAEWFWYEGGPRKGSASISTPKPATGTSPASTGSAEKNPFKPGPDFNLTEQSVMLLQDRQKAERLAAEAGVDLYGTNPHAPRSGTFPQSR